MHGKVEIKKKLFEIIAKNVQKSENPQLENLGNPEINAWKKP